LILSVYLIKYAKELLKTNDKYYVADIGLRYHLSKSEDRDMGHILENVVYLELLRRGYKVSIGKVGSKEVDFVAKKPDGKIEYYQVAQSVVNLVTFEREVSSLDKINDHNSKFLLTMDYSSVSHKGIEQINVLDWLMV
jgi:predicted AAA+ superfamily ATPase